MIKIHDKEFEVTIPAITIAERIVELADEINTEFEFGPPPVFIGVLDGSFRFIGDFAYHMSPEAEWSFVKLQSMEGTQSTGEVKQLLGLNTDIKDKIVFVVEDIIDTGITIKHIVAELRKHKPAEIRIMTLLNKPDMNDLNIHFLNMYVGFEIPNDFVVGYGLDYDGYGRGANDIYTLKTDIDDTE